MKCYLWEAERKWNYSTDLKLPHSDDPIQTRPLLVVSKLVR